MVTKQFLFIALSVVGFSANLYAEENTDIEKAALDHYRYSESSKAIDCTVDVASELKKHLAQEANNNGKNSDAKTDLYHDLTVQYQDKCGANTNS
jgi:hypothetical protein